jgi:hypothetical protein
MYWSLQHIYLYGDKFQIHFLPQIWMQIYVLNIVADLSVLKKNL